MCSKYSGCCIDDKGVCSDSDSGDLCLFSQKQTDEYDRMWTPLVVTDAKRGSFLSPWDVIGE